MAECHKCLEWFHEECVFTFQKKLNRFSGHVHVVRLDLIYSNGSSCNQLAVIKWIAAITYYHYYHSVINNYSNTGDLTSY